MVTSISSSPCHPAAPTGRPATPRHPPQHSSMPHWQGEMPAAPGHQAGGTTCPPPQGHPPLWLPSWGNLSAIAQEPGPSPGPLAWGCLRSGWGGGTETPERTTPLPGPSPDAGGLSQAPPCHTRSRLRYLGTPPSLSTVQAVLPPLPARLHAWYGPEASAPPTEGSPAPPLVGSAFPRGVPPSGQRIASLPLPIAPWLRCPVSPREGGLGGMGGERAGPGGGWGLGPSSRWPSAPRKGLAGWGQRCAMAGRGL